MGATGGHRSIGLALACALAVTALLAGCGRPRVTIAQIGSTTLLPLAERWRREFNSTHPDIDISVSGGGSGTGINALIAGGAAIANSSRAIKAEEIEQARQAGVTPVEHIVAHDGIAVIVHPSNPVSSISLDQLSDIFAGRTKRWQDIGVTGLGDIQVVSRDSASGTYEAFKELVVTLGGRDKTRDYAAAALKQTSNQAVLALVARAENAIGYVGLGYVDTSVKPVPVVPAGGGEAVAPTVRNVLSGDYPVSRPLYCYTNGEPAGALQEYLAWIAGPQGQAIVEELGFVPIS